MQRMTRSMGAFAAASVLVLTGAACGSDDASDDTTTTTAQAESGTDFLAEIEARGEPTLSAAEPATELVVTDDVEGTGTEVQAGDTITAHYTGVSASTGEVFDSSWTRGEPATFPLNGVIQGWSEGLVGMKEGGRRTLVIPGEMAYGSNPPPGAGIAPNETLIFTVDLVSVD